MRMVRTPIYSKLVTHLANHQQDNQEYNALVGHSARREWRKQWAMKRAIEKQEEMEVLESLETEDTSDAKWFTVRRISQEYGDDPEAAINYAKSCLQIGCTEFRICVLPIFLN